MTNQDRRICDTCEHDPPSQKWPCMDCDMRDPADRWEPNECQTCKHYDDASKKCGECLELGIDNYEPNEMENSTESSLTQKALDTIQLQDVPDNSDKDDLIDILEKCGIMWSDKFEKVITAKELALFYGEKYETLQRKIERFSNDLVGDVREINKSDELFDRLKRNRVISNKTPKIMVISPTGVAKIAYFSEGVKQHEVRQALSKINHRLHEELSVKYSDIYFLKVYQKEMSYLINNIFHSHKVENEKYVEGYRIDFLIDDHIAIECDESVHDYYNRDHEESRKKLMETKRYSFYRYDVRKKNMLSFVGDLIDKEMGNQTPETSDMVSRRAAIDALMDEFKRVPTTAIRAKNRIDRLPSAQPEQRWIPCSERLPDMWDERYLVSLAWGGIGVMEYKSTGFHNYGSFTPVPIESIAAWMPLPEPYAERRTDEGSD